MRRKTSMALGFLAASWLATASAQAGDAALAEQLFQEGMAALEAGDAKLACEKLAASLDAEPSGGTALNYGRCNEMLGKTATAWAEYKRAATLFQASKEDERRAFALERAADVEAKLPKLVIERSPGVDAVITRDGAPIPEAALGTEVPLDPGDYTIEASAAGHRSWSTTVTVAEGGGVARVLVPPLEQDASAETTPIGGPAPETPPAGDGGPDGFVVTGSVVLGVGAAAAIVGGVLGATVLSDADEAEQLCGGKECDGSADGREGYALSQDAGSKATASTLLVGVGAAVAVGGAILLLVGLTGEDDAADASLRWHPALGPSWGGLGVSRRF